MQAEIHENVKPTAITSTIIHNALIRPFSNRKPTMYPITRTMATRIRFLTRSNVVRPISTADLAIGRERNRSIRPFFMSSASPIAVVVEPKIAFCTKMPGIRNCT